MCLISVLHTPPFSNSYYTTHGIDLKIKGGRLCRRDKGEKHSILSLHLSFCFSPLLLLRKERAAWDEQKWLLLCAFFYSPFRQLGGVICDPPILPSHLPPPPPWTLIPLCSVLQYSIFSCINTVIMRKFIVVKTFGFWLLKHTYIAEKIYTFM